MVRRRPSMGRQQIQIHSIKSEEECQVCSMKRCARLFNKANELAILDGVEMAAVVFSPDGKAFSFGNPSFEAIRERFALTREAAGGGAGGAGAGEDNNQLADLNIQYREMKAPLRVKKAWKERADASTVAVWMEADVCNMGEEELMEFDAALQEVMDAIAAGRKSTKNNGAEMDMQMRPMMSVASPQGFIVADMEMMPQQGFGGFPDPN